MLSSLIKIDNNKLLSDSRRIISDNFRVIDGNKVSLVYPKQKSSLTGLA